LHQESLDDDRDDQCDEDEEWQLSPEGLPGLLILGALNGAGTQSN
jgi:hypothetical protein